jgi:hypothetical protein
VQSRSGFNAPAAEAAASAAAGEEEEAGCERVAPHSHQLCVCVFQPHAFKSLVVAPHDSAMCLSLAPHALPLCVSLNRHSHQLLCVCLNHTWPRVWKC